MNVSSNKHIILFYLGCFLLHSGVQGIFALASSISIEGGIGTTSLSVGFAVALAVVVFVPFLTETIGVKAILIIGELSYATYALANLYPTYTLIPGGVFLGIGEAAGWTGLAVISSFYAKKYSRNRFKDELGYHNRFAGFLFGSTEAGRAVSNAIAFVCLYLDRHISGGRFVNSTVDLSICGANDCQLANVTEANLERYAPRFEGTLFILIGIFVILMLMAVLVHVLYAPADITARLNEWKVEQSRRSQTSFEDNVSLNPIVKTSSPALSDTGCDTSTVNASSGSLTIDRLKLTNLEKCVQSFAPLKNILLHGKHLLIFLIAIYTGTSLGFVISELTRSYASCMLGVDQVGVGIVIFGLFQSASSYLAGKFAERFGRNLPMLFGFVLDAAIYVFCLLWKPTEGTTYFVYILFAAFGISLGILLPLTNVN
ncbi:unnamed protein product [Clavelina lepadiformis]|uniref:Uncharacterized protein n=1 Tax=Clavelina lepadiformis TaxID=159417 RepID=A0ABP0FD77_CLALP